MISEFPRFTRGCMRALDYLRGKGVLFIDAKNRTFPSAAMGQHQPVASLHRPKTPCARFRQTTQFGRVFRLLSQLDLPRSWRASTKRRKTPVIRHLATLATGARPLAKAASDADPKGIRQLSTFRSANEVSKGHRIVADSTSYVGVRCE
ncbi:hypothetical protein NVS89_10770 [Ancylobacter sp. MQZ15Z-1]|uniref:Uncharacterized protein n=1 Tax=Ancylobacter mangrovi TaxID=2972472 RepID=A0A9X2PB74_9HYPH|nr:hypothetical protein [Ancylobacter mangrovi]MCS0495582.1 hypothetical protein [Ancylobacter mangrovi]